MKVLTLNFLTCAVKACKTSAASFPLHPKDAELVSDDVELNPQLLVNLLPRIDWNALRTTATEVSSCCKVVLLVIHSFIYIHLPPFMLCISLISSSSQYPRDLISHLKPPITH